MEISPKKIIGQINIIDLITGDKDQFNSKVKKKGRTQFDELLNGKVDKKNNLLINKDEKNVNNEHKYIEKNNKNSSKIDLNNKKIPNKEETKENENIKENTVINNDQAILSMFKNNNNNNINKNIEIKDENLPLKTTVNVSKHKEVGEMKEISDLNKTKNLLNNLEKKEDNTGNKFDVQMNKTFSDNKINNFTDIKTVNASEIKSFLKTEFDDNAAVLVSSPKKMVIQVTPENLGKVEITLEKNDDGVYIAKLVIENKNIKEMIDKTMEELAKDFEVKGSEMKFDIEVEQSKYEEGQENENNKNEHNRKETKEIITNENNEFDKELFEEQEE